MIIKIEGTKEKLHPLLEEAIEFFSDKLFEKSKILNSLEINLSLENENSDKSGIIGDCGFIDSNIRPKEFEINIYAKGKSRNEILLILAHEMVHVKQYAKGELKERHRPYRTLWLDKEVDLTKSHWDHEYEIEALGREKGLFIQFLQKKKFKIDDRMYLYI